MRRTHLQNLTRISRRFKPTAKYLDPQVISSRDIYRIYMDLCFRKAEIASKIPFHNSIDKPEIAYYQSPDVFEQTEFLEEVESRTVPIQTFVGSEFPLSTAEKMQIISGLTELPSNITNYQRSTSSISPGEALNVSQTYSSDQFRSLGRRVYELQLRLQTTFQGNHLSMSTIDIQASLDDFKDPKLTILPFMKKNLIYECIIPFTGTNKERELEEQYHIEKRKEEIKDSTAIASFYTMLGMLCIKFGTAKVTEDIINDKIMSGRNGIIHILSENLSRSNKFS